MMKILKVAPGLDPKNVLGQVLGPDFEIADYDPARPLVEQVAEAEVLLLRDVPVPAEVIDAAPKLKLLQRYGQHVVGVDIRHAAAKGIPVARVPAEITGSDRMVAEHAMFLMLALAKRYKEAAAAVAAGELGLPRTYGLEGKTLGLIGVGRIGSHLARLARGFAMSVIAVKRTPDPGLADVLGLDFLGDTSHQEEVLGRADFVSIHLPLVPATVKSFGRRQFERMKPGSYLINIARGRIIDKAALYDALTSGHLAGAGLDVFWVEPIDPDDALLALPNVIATPHIAAPTHETEQLSAQVVAENIRRVASGKPPKYPVSADE